MCANTLLYKNIKIIIIIIIIIITIIEEGTAHARSTSKSQSLRVVCKTELLVIVWDFPLFLIR